MLVEGEDFPDGRPVLLPRGWESMLVSTFKDHVIDALGIADMHSASTSLLVHLPSGSVFPATRGLTLKQAYIFVGCRVTLQKKPTPPSTPCEYFRYSFKFAFACVYFRCLRSAATALVLSLGNTRGGCSSTDMSAARLIEEMTALRLAFTEGLRRVSSGSGDSGGGRRAMPSRRPPGDPTGTGRTDTDSTTSISSGNRGIANVASPAVGRPAVERRPVSTERALSVGAEMLHGDAQAISEGTDCETSIDAVPVPGSVRSDHDPPDSRADVGASGKSLAGDSKHS